MPKLFIYPYGPSNGALALARAVGGRLIRRANSKYKHRPGNVVLNWGSSGCPYPAVNKPAAVAVAQSKTETFKVLGQAGVPVPGYTASNDLANVWNQDSRVLGRDLDRGAQGRGITVYNKGEGVGAHMFYVRYVRKQREFRLHVFNGRVIFEQEKLQKNGAKDDPKFNKYIRSHDRGWCFAFNHLGERPVPEGVSAVAVRAVAALGLDFGAVDCAWNEHDGPVVLEVNTAPGVEESCLEAYAATVRALQG